jgi:hypothetical protein
MIYVQADQVSLEDETGLRQFLNSIPHPGTVRKLLTKGFFGRRWQQTESSDYWLVSDGKTAAYFRISGASAAQIYAIRLRFDLFVIKDRNFELTREFLCELVKTVTGEVDCSPGASIRIKPRR